MILRKNRLILGLLVPFMAVSCMKEEIAVSKHEPGNEEHNEVGMGQDYRNQLYFDLESNQVVRSNSKTEWDLAFESNGAHVILNSGKGMAIHQSSLAFSEITSAEDIAWRWDVPSGNLDSNAIGNWQDDDFTYVVDRGYDWMGDHQGYFKLEINVLTETVFEIGYGNLEDTAPTYLTIEKSGAEQFTYFSLESGQLAIAPPDTDYDLVFTQYIHLFQEPELTPYLVTGVLLNRGFTSIARLDEKAFESIVISDIESLEFSYDLNEIGYDWKYYSLDEGIYTTKSNQHYIIHTQGGLYYKFRFIGFYNSEGLKGYPNFEFQAL